MTRRDRFGRPWSIAYDSQPYYLHDVNLSCPVAASDLECNGCPGMRLGGVSLYCFTQLSPGVL